MSSPVLGTLGKYQLAPEPVKAESGLVDFRVRPYASIFVDGTFYGVTPFAKVNDGRVDFFDPTFLLWYGPAPFSLR